MLCPFNTFLFIVLIARLKRYKGMACAQLAVLFHRSFFSYNLIDILKEMNIAERMIKVRTVIVTGSIA